MQFIKSTSKQYGDIFTAHILGKEMTFLCHPRDYEVFFKATDDELGLREVYRFITPVFGRGIVYDTETSIMMEQLKFITSTMTTSGFQRFVTVFQEEAALKTQGMGLPTADNPRQIEAFEMLSDLIIYTASRCLLGDDVRQYLTGRNMAKHYRDIDNGVSPISFFFPNMPLPSNISRNRARQAVSSVFRELIKTRKEQMSRREEVSQDVLTELLRGRYKTGERLPAEHVIGILIATLFAGQHTSSIASTWTLMNIINNEQVYTRVMEEQEKVLGGNLHADLTLDKVREMEYLERCLREALRMYPPLIMLMRYVKKQRKYKDMVIPEGNVLVVSPALIGRLEDVYPNPDVFDPDRFLRGEHQTYPYANIAFGSGRHKVCESISAHPCSTCSLIILILNFLIPIAVSVCRRELCALADQINHQLSFAHISNAHEGTHPAGVLLVSRCWSGYTQHDRILAENRCRWIFRVREQQLCIACQRQEEK